MIIPKNILYAGLPVAASLLLGGCFMPTSEKADTASAPNQLAVAASYSVAWTPLYHSATSIAAGHQNEVYITGTDAQANGSHTLYSWDGSAWNPLGGTGFEVDVAANGVICLIGSDHKVYRSSDGGWTWSGTNSPTVSEIGANAGTDIIWALGTGYVAGSDHPVYKFDPTTTSWTTTSGGGVRIDVDPYGLPYVVNSAHDIWKGNSSGVFAPFGGSQKATDITVSGAGNIWIITNTASGSHGDKTIMAWDVTQWQPITVGQGTRISYDNGGQPWIIDSYGNTFRGNW
jgi:hypothetical protein